MIKEKEILLGVTGGIAAYKAAELTRLLVKHNAKVTVVMTAAARKFLTPLTLETLSGNFVYTEMFNPQRFSSTEHISLAEKADVLIVAPATANFIGKLANGIADDLLSTVAMATRAPIILAPAMNVNMWNNPIVQRNLDYLKSLGYIVVEPAEGELACGAQGAGRLAEIDNIVEEAERVLTPQDLAGKNILVTAGPTREHLDPTRFISNPSTGKMGFEMARVARRMGADVTLVYGPSHLSPPAGVKAISVVSAVQMHEAVQEHFDDQDIIIKAAAVADFRPVQTHGEKVKKQTLVKSLRIDLESNPDILKTLGGKKKKQFMVGFAAETRDLVQNAQKKLKSKNLDMIAANDVTRQDAGFAKETNVVKIISKDGTIKDLPVMQKEDAAREILLAVVDKMQAGDKDAV
jgi:phosphopantothenoylcysteine decarboxylase/phosphopantothenate--cysteine ligase